MEHEAHAPRAAQRTTSERTFGLVFAGFFTLVGILPLLWHAAPRTWAFWVAAAFAILALAVPKVLAPANRLWTRFGLLLHTIVSPIVLGVMFFVVVTPTGLLMRLLGKDLLRRRLAPKPRSSWVERPTPVPPAEGFKDQF